MFLGLIIVCIPLHFAPERAIFKNNCLVNRLRTEYLRG